MNRYLPTPAGNILDTTTGTEVSVCGTFANAARTARTLNNSLTTTDRRPSRLQRALTATISAMNLYPTNA